MNAPALILSTVLARLECLLQLDGAPVKLVNELKENTLELQSELNTLLQLLSDSNIKDAEFNKRVMHLAFDIEDAIEEQALQKMDHSPTPARRFNCLPRHRSGKKSPPGGLPNLQSLKKEIEEVKYHLGVLKQTAGCSPGLQPDHQASGSSIRVFPKGCSYTKYHGAKISRCLRLASAVDDSDPIVQMDMFEELYNLFGLHQGLNGEYGWGPTSSSIVAVVGTVGSGKTTLARALLQKIDGMLRDGDDTTTEYCPLIINCIWVTVSRDFNARDVIETILYGIHPEYTRDEVRELEMELLKEQLSQVARGSRSLIVLDDVWSTDVWETLKDLFPEDHLASFLVTTRDKRVANHLKGVKGQVFNVPSLSDRNRDVLYRETFGKYPGSYDCWLEEMGCPLEFATAVKYFEKCGKSLTGNMLEHIFKDPSILEAIAPSYDSLALKEKVCFLYLGLFPTNMPIRVEILYNLWMAEGVVPSIDMTEAVLRELADRNLVITYDDDQDGTVGSRSGFNKIFKPHSVFSWFYVVEEVKVLFPGYFQFPRYTSDVEEMISIGQRVVVHGLTTPPWDLLESTRSLLTFSCDSKIAEEKGISEAAVLIPVNSSFYENCRRTRSLYFNGYWFESFGDRSLEGIEKLVLLRYLGFTRCYLEKIPLAHCSFPYLETLDLRGFDICKLIIPNVIWKFSSLQHLFFPVSYETDDTGNKLKLNGLIRLEILENFRLDICDVNDLFEMKKLRIITVVATEVTADLNRLVDFIGRNGHILMPTLNLTGFVCYRQETLRLLGELVKSGRLQVLHLEGQMACLPEEKDLRFSEIMLTKIVFDGCEFEEDPMPMLGKLEHLMSLVLCNDAISIKILRFYGKIFPKLTIFKLANLQSLKMFKVGQEALPKLSILTFEKCPNFTFSIVAWLQKQKRHLQKVELVSMPKSVRELFLTHARKAKIKVAVQGDRLQAFPQTFLPETGNNGDIQSSQEQTFGDKTIQPEPSDHQQFRDGTSDQAPIYYHQQASTTSQQQFGPTVTSQATPHQHPAFGHNSSSNGGNFYEGAPQGNVQQQQQGVQQPLNNNGLSDLAKAGMETFQSLADLGKKVNNLIAQVEKSQTTTNQRLTELENDCNETNKKMQEILEKHR